MARTHKLNVEREQGNRHLTQTQIRQEKNARCRARNEWRREKFAEGKMDRRSIIELQGCA